MTQVIVFVNHVAEIGFRQTTALLVAAFVRHGCSVVLADVDGLSIHSAGSEVVSRVVGLALPVNCDSSYKVAQHARQNRRSTVVTIASDDLVVIRTNPGRDMRRQLLHRSFLDLTEIVQSQGSCVVNSPGQLSRFADKSSLALIDPQHRPTMIVTARLADVCQFIAEAPGDCVVKPVFGSRGANVIRVNDSTKWLEAILKETFEGSMLIAQHFVRAKHAGDRRIVILDGEILESEGHIAGIERHPAANDFRANLHAGGSAHPIELSAEERTSATSAAKLLASHGIRLAGVDLVSDQIIEFNVFSTGGLFDANRFAGVDFTDVIVHRFLTES